MAAQSLKLLAVPLGLEPMEAKLVTELPENSGWQFEPKWTAFAVSLIAREKRLISRRNRARRRALFPGNRSDNRRTATTHIRSRWRTRHTDRRFAILQRPADAHPSRREPDQATRRARKSANCRQRAFHGGQATMTPARFFLPRGVWMGPVLRVQASRISSRNYKLRKLVLRRPRPVSIEAVVS